MSPEFINMAKEAFDMFAFLAVELTILFLAVSYLVGVLQEYITPEKVRALLSSRNGRGYFIAALLGAITPFCSCSTIPFLKGLLKARAGFGPMMVFLFSSPLLNPIIIGLLAVTFGMNVAIFYFSIAMVVAVSAGYVLEKLGFEKYVRPEAHGETEKKNSCNSSQSCSTRSNTNAETSEFGPAQSISEKAADVLSQNLAFNITEPTLTGALASGASRSCGTGNSYSTTTKKTEIKVPNRWMKIWKSTWKDFKKTLPYLLLGITIGSLIYGFVPTDLIIKYAGENKWYSIPIAAVIGIPLYIRASAVIPLAAGLVQKGMALGSIMALIIGSAGASLTEVILLKSIFENQMIAAFLTVVLGMAMTAGYLYNILF